jgi:hypothetical protein
MRIGEALIAVPTLRRAGVRGIAEFEARCSSAGGTPSKMLLPRALILSLARANVERYRSECSALASITTYLLRTEHRDRDAVSCQALSRACRRMPAHWPTLAAVEAVLANAIQHGGEIGGGFEAFLMRSNRSFIGTVYAPETRRVVLRAAFATPLLVGAAVCASLAGIVPGAYGGPVARALVAVAATEAANVIAAVFARSPIAERGRARLFARLCVSLGSICALLVAARSA